MGTKTIVYLVIDLLFVAVMILAAVRSHRERKAEAEESGKVGGDE